MSSNNIFLALEAIAQTNGKNDKQALLGVHMKNEEFVRVVVYALNPFKTYGVAKRPVIDATKIGGAEFNTTTWQILDDLCNRTLSGDAARLAIQTEMQRLSPASAELFWRIIAKDLRAGFGESSVNKMAKGTIPDFPYMRCCLPKDAKMQEWDWNGGHISQEKADGMFANCNIEADGLAGFTSRQGTPFPREHIEELLSECSARLDWNTQTHGELLVKVDGVIAERAIGNGILNRVLDGGALEANERVIYKVWDQIPLSAVQTKGKHTVPYIERLTALVAGLAHATSARGKSDLVSMIDTRIVHSMKEAFAHYVELLKQGKEGTIVKKKSAIWKDGTSKEQVKLKLEAPCELEVIAIVPGRAGTKNEGRPGSYTCATACRQLQVDVTVKNEAQRDRIEADPESWIGTIITVISNSICEPSASNPIHSLFLPRFEEERKDKTTADTLDQVREQFAAAVRKLEDM